MRRVVILGRPNVGKSTLFNRMAGRRLAIVHDRPGVTRDLKTAVVEMGGVVFELADTPGLEQAGEGSLEAQMTARSMRALGQADVVLFVMDARAGLTPEDRHFASLARKSGLPVVVAANKAESREGAPGVLDACALGFGEPAAISAEHGLGMGDLWELLLPLLDAPHVEEEGETEEEREEAEELPRIAILGRPNAGKSTLMNALLGEERMLTGPQAGMTRDAISVRATLFGREVELVDTAGLRRKAKVQESLEQLSVGDALRALRFAHLVILVIDATQPLEKQDNTLAGLIEREGRACVLAVNKWDQIRKGKTVLLEDIRRRLHDVAPRLRGLPVIPVSAAKNQGMEPLLRAAFQMYGLWNRRIPTAELNRWLEEAISRHMPPLVGGRRIKLRYVTQSKTRPPSFLLFVNREGLPEHYLHYLRNSLRETFALPGIPLRLTPRTGKNPYI
jgi:GTP-binding protein